MKSTYFYSSITYVYLQIWIVSFNNIIFDFGLQLSCRKGVFNQINLQMIYVWKYGTMSKTNIFFIIMIMRVEGVIFFTILLR